MPVFIYFSGNKRAIATTNTDDKDIEVSRYVCILPELCIKLHLLVVLNMWHPKKLAPRNPQLLPSP